MNTEVIEQVIDYKKTYREYKDELDGVLQRAAEGFVKIGYLLKVARDTNILEESGYKSVTEFAEAEYDLNKTQVSRFISINDKFSEGGYSDRLMSTYKGYGYSKLTIMLQLPDAINEELTPEMSKSEIQTIKDEIAKEEQVTDIERYMETPNRNERDMPDVDEYLELLYKAVLQLGEDEPELYVGISDRKVENIELILPEIMAPAGDKIYSIRIKGIGRVILSISELSDTVKLINSRSGKKENYTWQNMASAWIYAGVLGNSENEQGGIKCWEQRYERKYPVVAPVQPEEKSTTETKNDVKKDKSNVKKTKPKKEHKVVKPREEWLSAYEIGQRVIAAESGEQGELLEKTADTGIWKVKLPAGATELHESEIKKYEEAEEIQESADDINEDIVGNTEKTIIAPVQPEGKNAIETDSDKYLQDKLLHMVDELITSINGENWGNVLESLKSMEKCIVEVYENE